MRRTRPANRRALRFLAGSGGANLGYIWNDSEITLSWDEGKNLTSYQLVRSQGKSDWEELYEGADASYTYQEADRNRSYKVRARNKHGFSDWSETIIIYNE